MSEKLRRAYVRGYNAASQNEPNPFASGTEEWEAFEAGWNAAYRDQYPESE